MVDKATDKQKKDDILDADLEYIINEEDKLKEKRIETAETAVR